MNVLKSAAVVCAVALMAPITAVNAETVPEGYPADYAEIIEASRAEGKLIVYSNLGEKNWASVLEGFNSHYPWIEVETLDLSSGSVHSRWEAEAGSNAASADMLVSGASDRWAAYGSEGGMLDYSTPELANLPDFANPSSGVYVLSADPFVISYNAALLSEDQRPTGMADLVRLAKENPGDFEGRITSYDASRSSFGMSAWFATMRDMDEGWDLLSELGPFMRNETSGGAMYEKMAAGEYVAGIMTSGIPLFPRIEAPGGEIFGFSFPDDGTTMILRGVGITGNAVNVNSAKLLLDYLFSNEGQTNLGRGGLTPIRDDVDEDEVRFTFQKVQSLVGAENMILADFSPELISDADAFVENWNRAMAGEAVE